MLFKKKRLTHIDAEGNAVMVDVSDKKATAREAVAKGTISMDRGTLKMIEKGTNKKGDVLAVAQVAGIQAAKRTSDLIPLCHPLALSSVKVDLEIDRESSAVHITAACKLVGQTGVEMEALTAVSAAALTVYDMCKAVDRGMHITNIRLVKKTGGKSGNFEQE
ncbi:MAG: cyclic pyranopterin monophosphate synthase MoaC [Rhodospirillaceae bacterium]